MKLVSYSRIQGLSRCSKNFRLGGIPGRSGDYHLTFRDLLLLVKFDSVLFANVFNNIGLTAFEFPRSLPRLYHVTVLKHGLKALDTGFGHCFGHATTSANSLVSIIVLMENMFISNYNLNLLNIRQNILLKHAIGINSYAKTTPLFQCLDIDQMSQHLLQA